ncbi:MAG: Cell shape-determining protein MreC [Parcubacteria group bacterium GW2011_GWC2_38_7]|nr:MAG: Cell shape-determining protein MreC [Parcubacteria group bacterium GW2011_GWC2_38_7]
MPLTPKPTKLIILTVVIIFLLFFLHYTHILAPVERLLVAITKPILQISYKVSNQIGTEYLDFKSKRELLTENKELKDQLAILLKEKSRYLNENEENDFLREQLKFSQTMNYEFIIANVIGKNVAGVQNSLLLDLGQQDGLKVGQPVLGEQGVVIGKISKVERNRSFMTLVNDDLSRLAAKIQGVTKTMGVVEGEFGLGIKMRLIPQNETISEGDVVVTSGLEELVPANLIVGQIEKIIKSPEQLFQEASIKSPIDFNKISMVNIIKTND